LMVANAQRLVLTCLTRLMIERPHLVRLDEARRGRNLAPRALPAGISAATVAATASAASNSTAGD
jgi:hypothetical protein